MTSGLVGDSGSAASTSSGASATTKRRRDFRKSGALLPTDGGFPYGEGQTYEKLGQHDKAVERYTEAIRRNAID